MPHPGSAIARPYREVHHIMLVSQSDYISREQARGIISKARDFSIRSNLSNPMLIGSHKFCWIKEVNCWIIKSPLYTQGEMSCKILARLQVACKKLARKGTFLSKNLALARIVQDLQEYCKLLCLQESCKTFQNLARKGTFSVQKSCLKTCKFCT